MQQTQTNCKGCGRFLAIENAYLDHERRGCDHRTDGSGIDICGCESAYFCAEGCADKWHQRRTERDEERKVDHEITETAAELLAEGSFDLVLKDCQRNYWEAIAEGSLDVAQFWLDVEKECKRHEATE